MTDTAFSIPFGAPLAQRNSALISTQQTESLLSEYVGDASCVILQVALRSFLDGQSPYNPLVFGGPTGTGKTLLARGFARRFRQARPHSRIVLLASADFARAYAEAAEANAVEDLRARLRRADLLVLDDLQHLVDKRSAQIELLHTIDHLRRRERQILVTLADLPSEHRPLLPGLASRLAMGLHVRLAVPGLDARREILTRLAQRHEVTISADALATLVAQSAGTVRELNGLMTRLAATHQQEPVELDAVNQFLQNNQQIARLSLQTITRQVARYFNHTVSGIRGPSRRQSMVRARGIAMFLSRELTNQSLEQIGRHFGRRDHTTVLHAYRKTQLLIESDASTRQAVSELTLRLRQPATPTRSETTGPKTESWR